MMTKIKYSSYLSCAITICLLSLAINRTTAITYYVSNSGTDNGSGSLNQPFRSIGKAASVVNPGDIVLVSGGTYWENNIVPANSGTEVAMIVFKPNPGTGDVILRHPGTSIADETSVFQLSNRNYIWMEGFHFIGFRYGKASIYIRSGEGNVVINNRFQNLGNDQVEAWDGNQVVALFNCTRSVVCNNYFDNIFGDGVNVNSQNSHHNLVSNNTFLRFKGKLRSWGGSNLFSRAIDVQDMSVGNNVIAFNYAKDVIHHIWLDRDGSHNVVLRNYGDGGSGTVFNESRCAFNVIQENISINMTDGFKSSYFPTTGWTKDARYINNVSYRNKVGFKIHKSERDEFRNNISFNNQEYDLVFTDEAYSNAPHIFKNNLWYSAGNTHSIEFRNNSVSVQDFQEGIGETNGLSENPLFMQLLNGAEDFRLQVSSPAKNAGDNGLDLGAYATYPKTAVGWDPALVQGEVNLQFGQPITRGERSTQVQLSVQLSKPASTVVSVEIIPVAGDAVEGEDFEFLNTSVTFQVGETKKQIVLDLLGASEHDELVAFRLTNATNAHIGARNLRLLRISKTPTLSAFAGLDQTIRDSDSDGFEEVILDASGSQDPQNMIATYVWTIDGEVIATGVNPTVELPLGVHKILLTITDSQGNVVTDEVVIQVISDTGIWLESECGNVGSLWNIEQDDNASMGEYVTIQPDNNSFEAAPSDVAGLLTYEFDVSNSGTYTLYTRIICPTANDDSFWLKMDSGPFARWNNIQPSTAWTWTNFPSTYPLNEGSHTLTIGFREDGARLDKIWITNAGSDLFDEGSSASNCEVTATQLLGQAELKVYPNPVTDLLHLETSNSKVFIQLYNSEGKLLSTHEIYHQHLNLDMTPYVPGIYFLHVVDQDRSSMKKVIKLD